MLLREMRPHELEQAVAEGRVLLLPAGCVELHGRRLPFGADTLFAEALCRRIAQRVSAVVAPTIDYGPTGYALSGPERGTVDVSGDAFGAYVKDVLRSLLGMGWRRIVVIIHHQGMDGPEALAFRKAAAELIFATAREERGAGWWGDHPPEAHGPVWRRIEVGPTILPAAAAVAGGDHAGKWETALMLHLRPDLVMKDGLRDAQEWYARDAGEATPELGACMLEAMTEAWVARLAGS